MQKLSVDIAAAVRSGETTTEEAIIKCAEEMNDP